MDFVGKFGSPAVFEFEIWFVCDCVEIFSFGRAVETWMVWFCYFVYLQRRHEQIKRGLADHEIGVAPATNLLLMIYIHNCCWQVSVWSDLNLFSQRRTFKYRLLWHSCKWFVYGTYVVSMTALLVNGMCMVRMWYLWQVFWQMVCIWYVCGICDRSFGK